MKKALICLKLSYKLFLLAFCFATLPFIALKTASFNLKELPFMFIAILGLLKFYLAKNQSSASIQRTLKRELPSNFSNQEIVNYIGHYKNAQDFALLANLVMILVLNIYL